MLINNIQHNFKTILKKPIVNSNSQKQPQQELKLSKGNLPQDMVSFGNSYKDTDRFTEKLNAPVGGFDTDRFCEDLLQFKQEKGNLFTLAKDLVQNKEFFVIKGKTSLEEYTVPQKQTFEEVSLRLNSVVEKLEEKGQPEIAKAFKESADAFEDLYWNYRPAYLDYKPYM